MLLMSKHAVETSETNEFSQSYFAAQTLGMDFSFGNTSDITIRTFLLIWWKQDTFAAGGEAHGKNLLKNGSKWWKMEMMWCLSDVGYPWLII